MTQDDDFARCLTSNLDRGLAEIDTSTKHRLALLRQQALSGESQMQRGHGVMVWVFGHTQIVLFLALVLLLAGGWFMRSAPRTYSPETDILLLTGDLPPHAYADKTFSQWLEAHATF